MLAFVVSSRDVPKPPPRTQVLVIYKRSNLQQLQRPGGDGKLQRFLEEDSDAAQRLQKAHERHLRTVEQARLVLRELGARATFRQRYEGGDASACDLVVTLGGDGTFLWASHLVDAHTPVVAINSAPESSVGHFCSATPDTMADALRAALAHELSVSHLTRMRVSVNDDTISNRVLNDVLFAHSTPGATSRYLIGLEGRAEEQKSSGVWVGPAAGSTAAMRSAGGKVLPLDSTQLQFVVREPYRPNGSRFDLVCGLIEIGQEFELRSLMDGGRLYLDGAKRRYRVGLGDRIALKQSSEPLLLLRRL